MGLRNLVLKWQILLLIALVVISLAAIAPNPNQKGLTITSIGDGPFQGNIETGTVVFSAGFEGAGERKELSSFAELIGFQGKKGYLNLDTDKGVKTIILEGNETFNVTADKVANSNLKFGLDIQGGTRAMLKPENTTNDTVNDVISTLQTRIDVYGLRQTEFRQVEMGEDRYIIVSIAGGTPQEIEQLLSRKGEFKATVPLTLKDGGKFKLGRFLSGENQEFTVGIVDNSTISIDDKEYNLSENFRLKGMEFLVKNMSEKEVVIEGLVFTSKDIVNVGIPPESSYMQKSQGGYRYQFGVVISTEGAKRFAEITQNLNTIPSASGSSLSEQIHLYLDEKEFDALSISGDLKGKEITNPVITGYGASLEEATRSRDTLKAVLKSGDLPTKVEIVSVDQLNSTLGESYLMIIAIAGMVAIVLVSAVIFIRYRNLKISFGVIVTMLCEVVLILGFAALTHWNLSALALAGLIAAIGFGVDNQIFIVDEMDKGKKTYTLKENLKRAYFMIFGSGATTIFAMLPILVLGFGVFKEVGGFALTTIVGVLVGIFITRPAFSKYVEYLAERE